MEDSGRKKTASDQICPIYLRYFEAQQLQKADLGFKQP